MSEIRITQSEEEQPEVRANFTVYFHAASDAQAKVRQDKIRHAIEQALADEDNGLCEYTYPETRVSWADHYGKPSPSAFTGTVRVQNHIAS